MTNRNGRPRAYTDKTRYIISVLWLCGMTEQAIADSITRYGMMPMTRKAVSGQINQTPFRGRDKMPVAVRQRFLDKLKAHRLDGGVLHDAAFLVLK